MKSRYPKPIFLVAFLAAGGASILFADSKVDYSKPMFGYGAVPEYEVPYEVPNVVGIKAKLDLIFEYTNASTSLKVFDNETGEEILDPSKLTDAGVVDRRYGGLNTWDYVNGVIIGGFDLIGEQTGDARYFDYNRRFYDFTFNWMPAFREREEKTGKRSDYHKMVNMKALDHCGAISAGLIKTELRGPDPRFREWIDVVADYISRGQFRLPDGTLARERPQAVSVWTDDFYMSIPFLAQMGKLTGDVRYFDDAMRQVVQLSERLFDRSEELYDHGWSEVTHPYDPRHYWARANGWAIMAVAELLTVLPADHPGREQVLHVFRSHVRGLVDRQAGDVLWHNLLDKESTYTETSASAMFVFAIARGVNEGWLEPLYAPVAITGWNGVASRILPDGRVKGICEGTTYANDAVYYAYRGAGEHTGFFGSVLLAGGEMIRLLGNSELKLVAPRANAVNSAMHGTPSE